MGLSKKRVLIIGDEADVREALTEFFRQFVHGHAYEVETASKCADGVRAVRRR